MYTYVDILGISPNSPSFAVSRNEIKIYLLPSEMNVN